MSFEDLFYFCFLSYFRPNILVSFVAEFSFYSSFFGPIYRRVIRAKSITGLLTSWRCSYHEPLLWFSKELLNLSDFFVAFILSTYQSTLP